MGALRTVEGVVVVLEGELRLGEVVERLEVVGGELEAGVAVGDDAVPELELQPRERPVGV